MTGERRFPVNGNRLPVVLKIVRYTLKLTSDSTTIMGITFAVVNTKKHTR